MIQQQQLQQHSAQHMASPLRTVMLAVLVLSHFGSCVVAVGELEQVSLTVLKSRSCWMVLPAKLAPSAIASTVTFLTSWSCIAPSMQRIVRRPGPLNEQPVAADMFKMQKRQQAVRAPTRPFVITSLASNQSNTAEMSDFTKQQIQILAVALLKNLGALYFAAAHTAV
jgi:hypothetical protein